METSPRFSEPAPQLERWWVAFSDGDPLVKVWWKPFVRRGFRHVLAFRALSGEAVLFLNPLFHRVENGVRFEPPHQVIQKLFDLGFRVCVVEIAVSEYDPARDKLVGRGLGVTCAALLAYTMGVEFRWRWTPWQLWKALKARGAEEIHGRHGKADIHRRTEAEAGQGFAEAPAAAIEDPGRA